MLSSLSQRSLRITHKTNGMRIELTCLRGGCGVDMTQEQSLAKPDYI